MKMGPSRTKAVVLGGLVVIGGYLFYSNVVSSPSSPSEPARPGGAVAHTSPPPVEAPERPGTPVAARRPSAVGSSRTSEEFRPSLKPKRPEDRVDPMSIDPTLRTDLLAKVQAVELAGGNRNLFQFGQPPPPPLPKEPIVPVKTPQQVAVEEQRKKEESGPPPPPPINLKYYGYSSARGDAHKHAFFLDGDEILVAAEGELVKKRYKVVRIGVNSVVMEDTQFKHEQTLPLAEEASAG
jgi:hypothetical protein